MIGTRWGGVLVAVAVPGMPGDEESEPYRNVVLAVSVRLVGPLCQPCQNVMSPVSEYRVALVSRVTRSDRVSR